MLLLGGALAIYLGFDELKDSWNPDETAESSPEIGETEDVEKYKKEIDDLKEEIKTLKKE
jgi:cell division protein FtsB